MEDKSYGRTTYSVRGEKNIMRELMEGGSVSVAFTVYDDFEVYSEGIYQHEEGAALGGHAVKIIGWGEEKGIKYWLVANSWNPRWGEKGYFRIVRGENECGIESEGCAATPLV